MISLAAPFRMVDGYTLLPDHSDPNVFYVLPSSPSLALHDDGTPAFSLIEYLGGGLGEEKISGGLLTLTLALGVDDVVLTGVAEKIRGDSPRAPRVVPVDFESGSVELIALGTHSGLPDAAGPFSVKILGSGRPSLGGDNRAVFQLLLDAEAAELVEKSIDNANLPLVAVYRLKFAGLRPSYGISIEADWKQVYTLLHHKAQANIYFASASVDKMVEETLKEQNIDIDTEIFGTGDSERAAAERARKQLLEWVLDRFFKPETSPESATANSIGRVVEETAWSLVRSVVPGVTYRLRQLSQEQLAYLSIRMDESIAETREVVPQGTLGGFLNRFRVDEEGNERPEWDALKKKLISKVNLDGFPRLEIDVGVEDRFQSDGLRQVLVELGRKGDEGRIEDGKTLVFRSAGEKESYIVNLLGENPDFANLFQYRMELAFDPAGSFGPQDNLQSEWKTESAKELYVEPRELYWIRDIKIVTSPTFSFALFPAVTVELRCPGNAQTGRVRLTQALPEGAWRFRTAGTELPTYEYRVFYHNQSASGGHTSDWHKQTDDWLSIADPFPVKRTLNLFLSLPWPELTMGFIQLRYSDPGHQLRYDEQIDLNSETAFIRRDYPIAEGGSRTLAYRLTLLFKNGSLLEGSWHESDDERILIDRRAVETRMIKAVPIGGTMEENRINKARLMIQARDPSDQHVRDETEMIFIPGDEAEKKWTYLLGDPPLRKLFYSGHFVDQNGFVSRLDWISTESDMVVVDFKHKRFSA